MPDDYWAMLPSDFWLMCEGYREKVKRERDFMIDVSFAAARYNSSNVTAAWSKDLPEAISKQKLPSEKQVDDMQPNDKPAQNEAKIEAFLIQEDYRLNGK